MKKAIYTLLFVGSVAFGLNAQNNVGIGIANPERVLDIFGTDAFIRINANSNIGGEAGLELVRSGIGGLRDWQLTNDNSTFKIMASDDNFDTRHEVMRISGSGNVGIGTSSPGAKLHIDNGEEASATGDGYMMVGYKASSNLVIDNNEIVSRAGGSPGALHLNGSNVYFHENGGNTYLAIGGGKVLVGNPSLGNNSRFGIRYDNQFQLELNNDVYNNDWFIGATAPSWAVGGEQLIFSPTNFSSASILRLMNVPNNESDGDVAPVSIYSAGGQALMLDGSEIDTKNGTGPLYINYNSGQNTYFGTSGGRVSIGKNSAYGTLLIDALPAENAISFQHENGLKWSWNPFTFTGNLGFLKGINVMASIDDASGQWLALSDERFKTDIRDMESILDKVNALKVYSYAFKFDENKTRNIGVLAQDLVKIFPELVSKNDFGDYTVAYSQFSVIAIKALQEQSKEIDDLEAELTALLTLAESK